MQIRAALKDVDKSTKSFELGAVSELPLGAKEQVCYGYKKGGQVWGGSEALKKTDAKGRGLVVAEAAARQS